MKDIYLISSFRSSLDHFCSYRNFHSFIDCWWNWWDWLHSSNLWWHRENFGRNQVWNTIDWRGVKLNMHLFIVNTRLIRRVWWILLIVAQKCDHAKQHFEKENKWGGKEGGLKRYWWRNLNKLKWLWRDWILHSKQ